jgi:hypothetical protein
MPRMGCSYRNGPLLRGILARLTRYMVLDTELQRD